jgi:hypothetical protein
MRRWWETLPQSVARAGREQFIPGSKVMKTLVIVSMLLLAAALSFAQ